MTAIVVLLCGHNLLAQSDYDDYSNYDSYNDYYNYYYTPCTHAGNIEMWSIVRLREGMAAWETPYDLRGTVKISDGCIEFECGRLEMTFIVKRKEKKSDELVKYYRENWDEMCDYMEMKKGIGRDKGYWLIYLGKLNEDDDTIDNTMQVVVKPLKTTVVK